MSETPSWKPRLVALDVDGTVLDPETQAISPAVRRAVRLTVEDGSHVVIATGRSLLGTQPVLDELELHSGAALCSNGAVLLDAGTRETVAVETFDPAPVHARLASELPGAIFAAEQLGTGSLVTSRFKEHELHGPQRLAEVDELISRPVPRLIANWVNHGPEELVEALRDVSLPRCTYTIDHYEPWVTVVPDGVTKGAALEKLRTQLGIPREDTLAIGDGDNDIQMLEWAGHGVAMGQAPDIVRAVATEITRSVTEDGVARTLSQWFGAEPSSLSDPSQ